MSQPQPACLPDAADLANEPESDDELPRDDLTGVSSRRHLSDALLQLEAARETSSTPDPGSRPGSGAPDDAGRAGILLIDVDRFRQVNDTLGYAIGDSLLKLIAGRLRRITRETDQLIRVGSDEFLVILPAEANSELSSPAAEQEIDQMAERIVGLLARPYLIQGNQIDIGASIGIAMFDRDVKDAVTLMQNADLALQEAKNSGRNRVCHFMPRMAQEAHQRRELEIDLRRALALQEFRVVYQPQVDIHTGKLSGFEALLRWDHPVRGMVSPVEFIPIAEDTGEIRHIGAWVLHEACLQASRWPGDLTIAVNVSPLQFDDGNLIDHVRSALSESGLSPERLEVEVTEGLLFQNPVAAESQLTELRELGIDIAMDDFGTGYSSLSHLSRFPFTKVKIDQSFVRGDVDDRTHALVNAIISLGASLGMKTLAEGVETDEQYQRLQRGGCDAIQGYLISRPMEAASTVDFVERCAWQCHDGNSDT